MDHTQKKYESGRGGTSLQQWIPNKSIAFIRIHQLKVLPNDDQHPKSADNDSQGQRKKVL